MTPTAPDLTTAVARARSWITDLDRGRLLTLVRRFLAPAVAVIYLVSWMFDYTIRSSGIPFVLVYAPLALTIALAVVKPVISFAVLVAVPLMQIWWWLPQTSGELWPIYFAALLVALFAGAGHASTRYLALPVGALASAIISYLVIRSGEWARMATPGGYDVVPHPRWLEFGMLALAAFGLYTAAWSIGVAAASLRLGRVLKAAETQLEETDFELRLSLDRARISRDVHDALAHSLTIVVSQAEGALALQAVRPEVAEESLRHIAAVGRTALVDVRRLVERIQDDDLLSSKPTTADLESLAEHMRGVGMSTSLRVLGDPLVLAPSQDIAVFRIVQESLTNALKHAGPTSTATVSLDWRGPGLIVLVTSLGGTPLIEQNTDGGSAGRGVGIEGMKERARLAGGWLTAVSAADDLFVLTAFIPVDAAVTPLAIEAARG